MSKFYTFLNHGVGHDIKDGSCVGVLWITELLVKFTEGVSVLDLPVYLVLEDSFEELDFIAVGGDCLLNRLILDPLLGYSRI